jgi:uncharacterized membrane protein
MSDQQPTFGERAADRVTASFGSWRFIWIQTAIVVAWMAVNACAIHWRWDPYPFILLNLVFSTQAAYAAPLILLSQNRQAARDRATGQQDLTTDTDTNRLLRLLLRHLGVPEQP